MEVYMSQKGNEKKAKQLGISFGAASGRLRKMLMFEMAKSLDLDTCHRCGDKITDIKHFSMEHKVPWMDSADPVGLFYDLRNVAFSHLSCNSACGVRPTKFESIEERLKGVNERRRLARLKMKKDDPE